jgi:hypothetical protein
VGVAESHTENQPPGLTRLLFLLVLLAGIVTMHAVIFAVGHDTALAAGHAQMATTSHSPDEAGVADRSCPGCDKHHSTLHACVFIMSAVGFVVAVAMLCRIRRDRVRQALSPLRHDHWRHQRAPPWTVLSLPELSILRI